ncbi:hypothetical protein RN001_004611 [Aquatica leii]|uniref:non-specific serine/threonine protein kinase n=1 Tax=Aquatica leii TaxID=1421715 RepID=A0AAN7PAY3_9COLE|nr:hypothetical protein RN001_004611 [Aquatica leii]
MEEDLYSFGKQLSSFIEKNQYHEAERFIIQINKTLTSFELPPFTIDTYFLNIFNESTGLLQFLKQILYNANYKKVKLVCFELLYTIVNNFNKKIEKHLLAIIKTCAPVVRSSASAAEKEKSLGVVILILKQGNLYANTSEDVEKEISDLYKDTLFNCLCNRFDKSVLVQERLFEAIGFVTKKFPSVIMNPNELCNILVSSLSRELQSKDKSLPVITGCLSALSNFLENFTFNSEDDKAMIHKVYNCTKTLADPQDSHRKVAYRENLSFISNHIILFSDLVYAEAEWWHQTLLKWFSYGVEDKKAAYKILESFTQEMANILSTRDSTYDRQLFKYFMDYFNKINEESTAENYEMQLAIRGLGLLAKSFKLHVTPIEINRLFVTISQILENNYILNDKIDPDQLIYLPHYIQTLSFIINNLPELHSNHIVSLQLISILLIKIFPQLSTMHHYMVIDAFVIMLYQLATCKQNILELFLENVIHQGVLWTCSHQIALDAELLKDLNQNVVTYKNHLPFWNGLLNIVNVIKYEKYEINARSRKTILKKLINELIKTLFLILNKINLSTKLIDENNPITDPAAAYQPIETNDFVIFVNVVDFYQEILENVDMEIFKFWIIIYINRILNYSLKYPLVSGFYKLLASCLKNCEKLNYFNDSNRINEDVQMCHYSLVKFSEDVLCRMKQYKGDLQIACLHLIMAMPVSVIQEVLPSISSAFLVLFTIGRSYLPLAHLGIDALEKWVKQLSANDIEPILKEVLSSLDSYLRSRSLGSSLESNLTVRYRKTKKLLSKRKILVQTEPELLKLQMKIMSFIGQLNNNLCMTFVSNEDNESAVYSDTSYLAVNFPYNNKLLMSMDRFVPRVLELSLFCSDRKMRVAACELLHAFILIILGTSKVADPKTLIRLDYLVRSVASPILKLACDMDEVVQQLFSSLAVQVMHYYSRPDQMETSHSHIVIEALMDSITNSTNFHLRDFSGKCIHEFVKWTIKQADKNDLLKNPKYIKIWIQNIQAFSVHTDPFKRLGAALIFNNIYTLIREETYMFNMFWLELLHAFVMNLSLTQVKKVDDNNCVDQVLQALNHLERGFVEKSNSFNENDKNRRKPIDLDGVLLNDVVSWLLKGTSSNNWHCRTKCMSMFCAIAPLVSGCNNSLKKYNDLYLSPNPEWICNTYETNLIETPTLKELKESTSTNGLFKWFHSLLCALDGYIFVVNNNFLPEKYVSEKSQLFTAIIFFLDQVMLNSINDVTKNIPNGGNIIYTAAEKEHYNYVKAKVVTKLMDLLIALGENKNDLTYAKIENEFLWKHNLGNFICHRIFDPLSMGFDFTDDSQDVIKLLNTISGFASDSIIVSLNTHIYSYINKFSTRYDLSSSAVPFKERLLLKGLLILNESYLSNKIDLHFFNAGAVDVIKKQLIEDKDNKMYIKHIHKTAKEFCELKLQLALCDKKELLIATQLIFENSLVTDEKNRKEIKYGSYFYQTFKDVLLKFLFENYATVLDEIFAIETGDNIFSYLFDLLKYARDNSKSLHRQIEAAIDASLRKWDYMIFYFNENVKSRMLGLELLSKLAKISEKPFCDVLQQKLGVIEWVIGLLNYEEIDWSEESSLSFKSEVINVLPCVLGKFDVYSTEISDAFQTIKARYYTDIRLTNKQIFCVTTFKKLLDAVKYSRSKILLKSALDIYISTPYINKDIDLDDILKSFIRHLSVDQQVDALNLVYQMSYSIDQFKYSHRYVLAKKVMPSLIQHCYYNAYEIFFVSIIETIKVRVGLKIDEYSNDEIVNKIINFILIELLFFRIKTDRFLDNTCNISKAAFPTDPPSTKNMLRSFTGTMIQTSKETYNLQSGDDKDIFRLYQCHAYNTLISLISNTQTSIDLYNALFIREDVWPKILDTDRKYTFEIDFDSMPPMRNVLINIRSEMLNQKRLVDPNAHTVNYIQSQHLFKSTLNEDVTKFDFTHSVLRSQLDEQVKVEDAEATQELGITLEEIQINFHECMAPICGVIQHMVDADINALPIDGANVVLPKWMKGIKNVLMAQDTHNNVKIFLVKVIHNRQDIFKYYAKFFYAPILKFISDGVIGNNINFFVTDLVVMLTSWSSIALPSEDKTLASSLLKFLMCNCDNDVKNIFKYNLELIKLLLETWKTCVEIPYDFVYAKLQLSEKSQKLDVGVHLAATILANNIAPWSENELKNFLMVLSKILKNSHVSVYQPCSEVLGMALNFISQDATSYRHLEKFKEYLHKQLEKLSSDDNKFAYCLQGIALHYPDIANNYLVKLNSKLKFVQGNFKNIYLRIFLARVDELHVQNELSSIDFRSLLLEENLETQELTLEIIKKSILYLKVDQQLLVLKEVANFVSNSSTSFRTLMYEIFIIIYNDQNQQAEEVTELSKDILLQGLVDKETIIRDKLLTFWASDSHLPKDISNAFLYLLNAMYKPNIEENYVCYSAYFLLNLLKETKEYSEKLFKYPLYNCDFQDYNLVSNWRRQHASMAPLFATSLSSQDATMHVMNPNVLRATVTTLEFQPTQLGPHTSKQYSSLSTSSLFSLKEEEGVSDGTFKDPNIVLREGFKRSRRFIKNKSKISRYFADEEVKKSLKQEELRKERIQKSEKSVNLCRKYRIGEYPDIEITLSSVINPLQTLALCDAPIARHLYTSLFTSLVTHMKQTKMDNTRFLENVKQSINYVLSNSTEFAPNTIGAFLDIALSYKNEMQFDPAIISNVSEESGLLSIGSLLLEEYLDMNVDVVEPTPAKRARGVETANTYCWVKLAELYKEMNEWDVVTAIFMEKMNGSDTVVKAIEAESTGHWRAARGFYAQVIGEDTSVDRRDFYYESYFKSFAALGEWDELTEAISHNVCTNENDNTWNLLWDDNWNQHKLLPWYITAGLRNRLLGGNRDIFTEINECLQDPHKSEYLKNNFGEELAMLCLLQDDCDTANYYLNNTVTKWLENWSHLNPLFLKLRANTLFNLKGVIDLYLFINFIDKLKVEDCKTNVEFLLKSWTESSVDSMESLLQSETSTVYRNQFITVMQQKLLTLLPDEEDYIKNDLNAHKFKLHINLTERALEQENYYVARKYVKIAAKFKHLGDLENMQLPLSFSKIIYFMSQTIEDDESKIKSLLNSWERLGTLTNKSVTNDNKLCYIMKSKRHIYDLTQKIHAVLSRNDELYNRNKSNLQKFMGNVALTGVEKIWEYGVNELKAGIKYCEGEVQKMMNTENLKIYSHMSEAYVKLAYCTQYKDNMDETFIVCVLRAMMLGSSEGKQLFPCLLNKNIAEFRNTFKLETSKIPTWMFLKWIPQLLANLDTSCIYAIDDIILEIAKVYPQAIMFPYRISQEKYKFEPGGIENLGKTLMQKLNELLLPGELMENFLKAISFVTPPVNVLTYYLKKLKACNTEQEFKDALQNLLNEVFSEHEKYIDYRDAKSVKGLMFKEIAGYEIKLRALLKGKFDLAITKNKIMDMQNALSVSKFRRSIKLFEYSPWLANFQASELYGNLEIPGQYTGEKRPLVQYHTKIMGFAPMVHLLESMRAPIRITILGNDGKQYKYLVKFGEDLRQDQRIEQIFILMNNVLLQDSNCNKRQMNLTTYQVIPLNSRLGVIEWLNDTIHLKEFIETGLSDQKSLKKSQEKYMTWINKAVPKKINDPHHPERYGFAFLKYKDKDFMDKYTELVNYVEADVLRKSFKNISINSESFFALRHKFVVSYAVICISQWLLGIGDRHLENTLISLRNGGAIGIDFGYAFGVGTQILPIPELVPFRLTPHILNLLQPLGEHGLLQETMIHCMRAFKKRSDILLATMNVFIKEPSIDWIEFARRFDVASGSTIKKSWYSGQKIDHAKQKLEGANPVKIMIEELESGHSHNPPLRDIYVTAVKGKAHNFRATVNDNNLTEEDQVKCLLDHATDYNVLGRMYEGWCAWV